MKKIALLLAMVMLLVCVLASCGGTTEESKANTQSSAVSSSTDTSKEESNGADESKEASEEPENSADESVEPEESDDPIEPAAVGELVSVGKPYTKSELFRMGSDWKWDETADPRYPDEDDKSLTDGIFDPEDNKYQNVVWAGFSKCPVYETTGYHWITIDLGEKTDISKISIYLATSALGSGISCANSTIEYFVSDDGENWTSLGTESPVDDAEVNYVEVSKATNTSGQYVQVRMVRDGWVFVSEVSVYDVAAE